MSEQNVYPVDPAFAAKAHADDDKYQAMYEQSINDPEAFWGEQGKRLDWFKPYTKVKNTTFDPHTVDIKWYEDGELNASYNCLDRHLETVAIRSRSSGKATTRAKTKRLPTVTCTHVCVALPTR